MVAVAAVAVSLAIAPARSDDLILGSGDVKSQFLSVGPETAGLAAGVVIGETLADYQNDIGRAQARSVNTGVAGTTLTADSCPGKDPPLERRDLPMTVRVDSREPGAPEGRTGWWPIVPRDLSHHFDDAKEENGGFPNLDPPPESPARSNVSRLHSRATGQPFSHATSDTGVVSVAGAADVTGGHTSTTTRVEDGRRIAEATVTIPELQLGGGAVVLRDLEWRAVQTTGRDAPADTTFETSFRMGSVTAGGTTFGWPEEANIEFQKQAAALLNLVNTTLAPSGLAVVFPTSRHDGDHATVTPLEVKVERPPLGRELFAMLPEELYQAREPIAEALITNGDCKIETLRFSSLIAVGDITLATPAGAGATRVAFGGADAFTEGTEYGDPFAVRSHASTPFVAPVGSDTSKAAASVLGEQEFTLLPHVTPAAPGGGGGLVGGVAAGDVKMPGSKSGTAALVGGIGLVAVLAVALLDFLKPRRAVGDAG